jgi:uncharacterized protein
LVFRTDLVLSGQAQWVSSGEVVVRLVAEAELTQECRRCLEPVTTALEQELTLVYSPTEAGKEPEDEDLRLLPENSSELDLAGAIREEVLLTQTPFVLCAPDCRGLCPRCGTNRNVDQCQCSEESTDPRWDALRALRDE